MRCPFCEFADNQDERLAVHISTHFLQNKNLTLALNDLLSWLGIKKILNGDQILVTFSLKEGSRVETPQEGITK